MKVSYRVGEHGSVHKVLIALIENENPTERTQEHARIVLDRIGSSMPEVFSLISSRPEVHMKSFLTFLDAVEILGQEDEVVATVKEIDQWIAQNGRHIHETYRVCVVTFIQRGLVYNRMQLDLIDADALKHLLEFLVPIKNRILTKGVQVA